MGIHKFSMPHKVRQYIVRNHMVRIARAVWANETEYLTAYGGGNVWALWSYESNAPTRWFFFEKGGRR